MAATPNSSELKDFMFFPKYDDAFRALASMAAPEPWDFSSTHAEDYKNAILKSYLEHTFRRLKVEKKIVFTESGDFTCFNTGLVSVFMEEIFAIGFKNKCGKSPYVLKSFCKKSDAFLLSMFGNNLPAPANYFTNPKDVVFDPSCEIICQYDHIISDNRSRFPKSLNDKDEKELAVMLRSAIEETKLQTRTNYTLAIPHYYEGEVQLMLPLFLVSKTEKPDLALVITRIGENCYTARTVLTFEMAYNDARVIVKPKHSWLSIK